MLWSEIVLVWSSKEIFANSWSNPSLQDFRYRAENQDRPI